MGRSRWMGSERYAVFGTAMVLRCLVWWRGNEMNWCDVGVWSGDVCVGRSVCAEVFRPSGRPLLDDVWRYVCGAVGMCGRGDRWAGEQAARSAVICTSVAGFISLSTIGPQHHLGSSCVWQMTAISICYVAIKQLGQDYCQFIIMCVDFAFYLDVKIQPGLLCSPHCCILSPRIPSYYHHLVVVWNSAQSFSITWLGIQQRLDVFCIIGYCF